MNFYEEQTIEITNEQIEKWHPLIALPCYDRLISEPTTMSLIKMAMQFKEIGLKFAIASTSDSLISRGRNQLAAKFLGYKEATHLMFIDCDLGFEPDDIIKLLWHDKDVITGAYPIKDINWQRVVENVKNDVPHDQLLTNSVRYVVNAAKDAENNVIKVENGALDVYDAGTGFMMIKRECFEKMIDAYPELKYEDDTGSLTADERNYSYAFFNSYVDPEKRRFLSEDYGFCRYWQEIGGRVWTDPSIDLMHLGRLEYKGSMLNWLEKNATPTD